MKFMHLGDLHLGKSLSDFDLYDDQKYILDELMEIIDREKVDALLIAGDVYDKSVPSEGAIDLLDYFLKSLSDKGTKVYMISGNHDSDDRLNYGSSLFSANNIFISAIFDGTLNKYEISDNNTKVNIYLLPFVKASQVKHFFPDAKIENYEDAVRTIIENTDIDDHSTNILVAHQFVAGSEDPHLAGSESVAAQSVGTVERISAAVFDRFDYVALGHIHSPQKVGREEVRYCGSPLKYSLSEVNNDKSVPIITIESGAEPKIDLIPLKPKRDMRHIRGKFKDLLEKENIRDPEDFIYATLTDEETINDAMSIFQQYYPNTVRIDYDNKRTRELEQVDISNIAGNKSFAELIGDFYSLMYGCEMTDEELHVMEMAAREAGVLHEAD